MKTISRKSKQNSGGIQGMAAACIEAGGQVFGKEYLPDEDCNPVLLVSHELTLTGAPIVLLYLAESLRRQKRYPVVIAPQDGKLRSQWTQAGFSVLVLPDLLGHGSELVVKYADCFAFVLVNTNVGAPVAAALNGRKVSVLWWIHEANVSYHPGALAPMPDTLESNVHVYCVNHYAAQVLQKHRPAYPVHLLLNCLPDPSSHLPDKSVFPLEGAEGKTVFVTVATVARHKGQDVLAEAIRRLTPEQRAASLFVFVGKEGDAPIVRAVQDVQQAYPQSVRYVGELSRQELFALYTQMDCAICPSRDDCIPITVTEAMALSRPVICSANIGTAPLLEQRKSGYLYDNDDPAALAAVIAHVLGKPKQLARMRRRARRTYKAYFTRAVFDKHVKTMCDQIQEMDGYTAKSRKPRFRK